MTITIVADVFGEGTNGTALTIKRLISHLEERGHIVRVVAPHPENREGYYALPTYNFYFLNGYFAKNGVEIAKGDETVFRHAFLGADVVHLALPFPASHFAMKVAREMKIPYTTAFHCQAENITAHFGLKDFTPANDFVYKMLYNKFYKYNQFIHCPSQMIANLLRNHGYTQDLRVIPNGINENFHPIPCPVRPKQWENKILVAFVGRLSREKTHPVLIEAVKLSKHEKDIQLVFAGSGPREKALRRMAQGLTNPLQIQFFKQDELVNFLNCLDVYVHPSDIEIEVISCLEAIACGCVPVISDSVRSATNSFALSPHSLFKRGDAKDLAEKIDYLIDHPEVKAELKSQYLQSAEKYKIARCIDQMEQMFHDAIDYYTEEYKKES